VRRPESSQRIDLRVSFPLFALCLVPLLFSRESHVKFRTLKTKDSAGEEEDAEHSTPLLFIAAVARGS
jgi:hypothetical protein